MIVLARIRNKDMVDVGLDSEGKARGSKRPRIKQKYEWNDKSDVIGEGTYGLVYRAKHKVDPPPSAPPLNERAPCPPPHHPCPV
jgi:hypothetical protein